MIMSQLLKMTLTLVTIIIVIFLFGVSQELPGREFFIWSRILLGMALIASITAIWKLKPKINYKSMELLLLSGQ
jgi:hypothetical protein